MPTCGRCKTKGVDIAHVRSCYGMTPAQDPTMSRQGPAQEPLPASDLARDLSNAIASLQEPPTWPGSPKQIVYAMGLQEERILPDDYHIKTERQLQNMERDAISSLISMLKTFPKKEGNKQREWSMPEGRYAIEETEFESVPGVPGGSTPVTHWTFWEVSKPDQGRWAGYTFIKMLVGAPGNYRKVNVGPSRRNNVLAHIDADPKKAMVDYGLHSEVCGRCSSPLSDPESLVRGMGPKCASISGWF
jgi:Family of unknown function (DUF6011)